MYLFGKITVNPQLPRRISSLSEIANNVWWSWNSEFLRIFQLIDLELWNNVGKNPVKFLAHVSQSALERAANDENFLKEYDTQVKNFYNYINSKDTWFNRTYPQNKNALIAYFSAEYGLDEILPIYSGGLGILSADHLKSSSDLGLPLVAVGLLYKQGYFQQQINASGVQETEYKSINVYELPILPVTGDSNKDLIISIDLENRKLYLKVWKINVGRVTLYMLDSDIELNSEEDRKITSKLYGGDQDMRIRQEIVLGIGGVTLLKALSLNPTVYHMNEGHSSFATLEIARNLMEERQISFDIAKDIVTSKTVFTTHTPVPAGNDIFPYSLMDKYFSNYWPKLGLDREQFLNLGKKSPTSLENNFNMGILALKIAGKKNGVSKLHGAVSKELFGDIWNNIALNEVPIDYITNGVHTCSWLAPKLKELYNKYFETYWQDKIYDNNTWKNVDIIPDKELWDIHLLQKEKLLGLVKNNIRQQMLKNGDNFDKIKEIESSINPFALTIGFARRFATYKRATLIFKDLERITKILNNPSKPVQLIFAGKAHPADTQGQELIKYIHEISRMPQFKGKVFLLENYNISNARYLISGVDVWLNNPRRPMEASGTSGQKAAVNGVPNLSILDGWWAEGYNGHNGWAIGDNTEYDSFESQDIADSNSIYDILENEVIPKYYDKNSDGIPTDWIRIMKNSIKSCGGNYSTSRMLVDYTNKFYIPLSNLTTTYYKNLSNVTGFSAWKKNLLKYWNSINILQKSNMHDISINAGNQIDVECEVELYNMKPEDIATQVYYGKITDNGSVEDVQIIPMALKSSEDNKHIYTSKLTLNTGGHYGYTFRVVPKNNMITDVENLNLVKWIINN